MASRDLDPETIKFVSTPVFMSKVSSLHFDTTKLGSNAYSLEERAILEKMSKIAKDYTLMKESYHGLQHQLLDLTNSLDPGVVPGAQSKASDSKVQSSESQTNLSVKS
jgi:hypothetical protein